MKPRAPSVTIHVGDAVTNLRAMPADSVHCCVTSPPYWGLRDYGVAGQIGLEADFLDYIEHIVAVFREVRRVLRPDGTLWLNIGDSYAGGGNGNGGSYAADRANWRVVPPRSGQRAAISGLKPKDLIGIPWMLAFALRDDGWWLRQDIIWSKPNPMPESVTDRCTKAHEYLFLLSRSERYYYNAKAIAEAASYDPANTKFPDGWDTGEGAHGAFHRNGREKGRRAGNKTHKGVTAYEASDTEEHRTKAGLLKIAETAYPMRNKRSVWTIASAPFPEAHFATFPPALVEPCILAGCPEGGSVLDPFLGAGTTALVADRLGRSCIGIELNPDYAMMARRRLERDAPLFANIATLKGGMMEGKEPRITEPHEVPV